MKIKGWAGQCQQCFEETSAYIMSMYSTTLICMECKDKEERRSDYKDAVDADIAEIKKGNLNFEGIGEK